MILLVSLIEEDFLFPLFFAWCIPTSLSRTRIFVKLAPVARMRKPTALRLAITC